VKRGGALVVNISFPPLGGGGYIASLPSSQDPPLVPGLNT